MNNVMNCDFVIIADGHFNPLGIARALGRAGIRPRVIVVGDENALIAHSRYPQTIKFVESHAEAVNHLLSADVISHLSSAGRKVFLMTGSDKTISEIDRRYDELSPYYITYNCGHSSRINRLMNKGLQNEMAKAVGLNVPDFEEVEVGTLPSHVKYPIITKAVDSTILNWKSLVHICRNEEELLQAYSKMSCKRILLQHFVAKDNETGFNGIAINHGKDVYLPLQISYYNTEVDTIGNYFYLFKPVDTDFVAKVKALITSTGYEGAFSVDFLIGADGVTYFLEINFRNSAWAFPYTCAGINLPLIWAESMLTGKLETDDVEIKKTPFSCIVDLHEISAQMKKGIKPGFSAIWHALTADCHILYDRHDTGPFKYIVKEYIRNHF